MLSRTATALVMCFLTSAAQAAALDLSKCVVFAPTAMSGPEKKAIQVLVEEVEKRTQITLSVVTAWPAETTPVFAVGSASALKSFAGTLRGCPLGRGWCRRAGGISHPNFQGQGRPRCLRHR